MQRISHRSHSGTYTFPMLDNRDSGSASSLRGQVCQNAGEQSKSVVQMTEAYATAALLTPHAVLMLVHLSFITELS